MYGLNHFYFTNQYTVKKITGFLEYKYYITYLFLSVLNIIIIRGIIKAFKKNKVLIL